MIQSLVKLANGKQILDQMLCRILSPDGKLQQSLQQLNQIPKAQNQIRYAKSALKKLKDFYPAILDAKEPPLQLELPGFKPFTSALASVDGTVFVYSYDSCSSETRKTFEQFAYDDADRRCQACNAPHSMKRPLIIHQRSELRSSGRPLTVLCSECHVTFAETARLAAHPGNIYQYDSDNFDKLDKSTWLMTSTSTTHIEWAEDFDLEEWSDYCPFCGSLNLHENTSYVVCISCGENSLKTERNDLLLQRHLAKQAAHSEPKLPEHPREYPSRDAYRASPEWAVRQAETKKRDGVRCIICNGASDLSAHHRNYEREYNEHPADLMTLCQPCHDAFHFNRDLWKDCDCQPI